MEGLNALRDLFLKVRFRSFVVFLLPIWAFSVVLGCRPYWQTRWEDWNYPVKPVDSEVEVNLFEINSGGNAPFLGVPVRVGNIEFGLLLDTGASISLFSESFAERLAFRCVNHCQQNVLDEIPREQPIYVSSGIFMKSYCLRDESFLIVPENTFDGHTAKGSKRPSIVGILGANILRRGEVTIDLERRLLKLAPFGASGIEAYPNRVLLGHDRNTNAFFVQMLWDGIYDARMLLDTGFNGSIAFVGDSQLGQRLMQSGHYETHPAHLLRSHASAHRFYRIPFDILLGDKLLAANTRMAMLLEEREEPGNFDGLVGMEIILGCRKVIVDSRKEYAVFLDN